MSRATTTTTDNFDSGVSDLDTFLAEELHDPEFARALEDAEIRAAVLRQLTGWRRACSMTQSTVAAMMGTTQSAVSDLEAGDGDPQLSTLQRYARAIGARLTVSIVAPGKHHLGVWGATPPTVQTFQREWIQDGEAHRLSPSRLYERIPARV